MATNEVRLLLAIVPDEGAAKLLIPAVDLAQRKNAKITAVCAMEPLTEFGQSLVNTYLLPEAGVSVHQQSIGQIKEGLMQQIQQVCKDAADQGIIDDIRVIDGRAEHVILNLADELDVSMIVMGAHRHSRAAEALLGTTTFRVLHSATRPVLVIPHE